MSWVVGLPSLTVLMLCVGMLVLVQLALVSLPALEVIDAAKLVSMARMQPWQEARRLVGAASHDRHCWLWRSHPPREQGAL